MKAEMDGPVFNVDLGASVFPWARWWKEVHRETQVVLSSSKTLRVILIYKLQMTPPQQKPGRVRLSPQLCIRDRHL